MAVIEVNDTNFQKEVVDNDIPVIIDFFAPWCGPCQMMGSIFEELSGEYEGKLKFAKLNTETSSMLASQYNITGIPCLIIAKGGKEVDRIVGFAPGNIMKQKIDEVLSKI